MLKLKSLFPRHAVAPEGGGAVRSAEVEIKALLAEAMEKQKGVALYVGGGSIGALVTEIGADFVVGRSREFSRIVVRLDRIDAVTMS